MLVEEEVDTEGGVTVVIESCTVEGCTYFGTSERKMLQKVGGSLPQSKPQAETPS